MKSLVQVFRDTKVNQSGVINHKNPFYLIHSIKVFGGGGSGL